MSANTKWSSLSQEVIRRIKNTSGRVSHVTRESILTEYMRKLVTQNLFGARFLSKAWKVIPKWSSLRLQALVLKGVAKRTPFSSFVTSVDISTKKMIDINLYS